MLRRQSKNPQAMNHALLQFVTQHPQLLVLTGAGCSLASGIPTYRDKAGNWRRTTPIQHQDFVNQLASRQRYWARSFAGWPRFADALPNAAHQALVKLEQLGHVSQLVTQNIDGLHQRAGQQRVLELHGSLAEVICLKCASLSSRFELQARLARLNPQLSERGEPVPDGDADVPDSLVANVKVPDCERCGGILKPQVVFFGGSVSPIVAAQVSESVARSDGVLVVGSSLQVFSGYRIVRRAHELGKAIACINPGATRADPLYTLKSSGDCGEELAALSLALKADDRKPAPGKSLQQSSAV